MTMSMTNLEIWKFGNLDANLIDEESLATILQFGQEFASRFKQLRFSFYQLTVQDLSDVAVHHRPFHFVGANPSANSSDVTQPTRFLLGQTAISALSFVGVL